MNECASSLLPNDCPLQRLAFQMRSSYVEIGPLLELRIFVPLAFSKIPNTYMTYLTASKEIVDH